MRMAYVCTDRSLAIFGNSGRAAYIQEVLRALLRRGAQIHLYAARLDGDKPEGLRSLVLHKLSLAVGDMTSDEAAMSRANRELRKLLEGARGGGFEMVLERFSPWSFGAMDYAVTKKIPGVLEVTDAGIDEFQSLKAEMQKVARATIDKASLVVGGSSQVLEELEAGGCKAVRIPGELDPERYSTGARLTIRKTGAFTVGYLGPLESWAALEPVVEAFTLLHRKHPEARILVEGDGSAKTQMITELSRRGLLGTACFLGKVPPRRIAGVLSATDVTVVGPDRDPSSVHDSMLAGVPVVSCAQGELLVRDRVNGLLCPAGDSQSLFALLESLHEDRILRLRLGSNARRSMMDVQVWDRIAECVLEALPSEEGRTYTVPGYLPDQHPLL